MSARLARRSREVATYTSGKGTARTDKETSPNGTTNGNHVQMARPHGLIEDNERAALGATLERLEIETISGHKVLLVTPFALIVVGVGMRSRVCRRLLLVRNCLFVIHGEWWAAASWSKRDKMGGQHAPRERRALKHCCDRGDQQRRPPPPVQSTGDTPGQRAVTLLSLAQFTRARARGRSLARMPDDAVQPGVIGWSGVEPTASGLPTERLARAAFDREGTNSAAGRGGRGGRGGSWTSPSWPARSGRYHQRASRRALGGGGCWAAGQSADMAPKQA